MGALAKTLAMIFLGGGVAAVGQYVSVTYQIPGVQELLGGAVTALALWLKRPGDAKP